MYFERKYKLAVWAVSALIAIFILVETFRTGVFVPTKEYMIPLEQRVNNTLVMSVLIAIIPPAFIEYNNSVWLREVDNNIPRLLRDLTESIRSGLSLFDALELAAEKDYGPITPHLEQAMVKFRLTSDLEGSLIWLGEELIRPSAKRVVTILLEAYETGGRMIEVLETSVDMFTSLAEYKDEKEAQVSPYILLVYVGNIIFLGISWSILAQFLGPLAKASQDPLVAQSGMVRMLNINYYRSILFWSAIIEGLMGGLVAGKIRDNRIGGGLVHSVILLLISITFFNLIL
ncbi:MAG: type II secretion system F family protein [Candidatus Bathyarchaeia archaeon]